MFKVGLICGSLRKASTNLGLLRAIVETRDKRFDFDWINIHDFEMINEDVLNIDIPRPIQKARDNIKTNDALLFAVPEYNYAVAAPLKNAYDWFSRDDRHKKCEITEKVGAMVSSAGFAKGGNAQENFRKIVEFRKLKLLTPSSQA